MSDNLEQKGGEIMSVRIIKAISKSEWVINIILTHLR